MKLIYQIPRNSLAWLLMAYLAVIVPHMGRLPLWISLASLVTLIWRVQVYRGRWRLPPRWIKYSLAGICGLSLYWGYGRFFGLEPTVALLVIAYSLKLLEMQQRRDALLVIYLAYFLAATQFLFEQSMLWTVYVLFTLWLITTALIGLNQSQGHRQLRHSLGYSGKLLLQAMPLVLLLFVLLPRVGSLWSVPTQQQAAKTGISDNMTPGDIGDLVRSGELAFRVAFDGPVPANAELYWRGPVLSRFDGRTWTQGGLRDYYRDGPLVDWPDAQQAPWRALIERRGQPLSYEIILEPTHQSWIFALATPVTEHPAIGLGRDFSLVAQHPIDSRLRYRVQSWLDHRAEALNLPDWRREMETRLPEGFNPQTLALAQQWRAQTSSTRALVERVLQLFNADFFYTLQPPTLGRHSVDEFLFQTKRGFCEHFASSFVFFMRAAGVPARVVTGYQGAELNPFQDYLLVHQFDAHAWAEVWYEGQGWQRVDPTAAVAPQRIERGARELMQEDESFLSASPLSLLRFQGLNWINLLRLRLDMLDYAWHRWVLSYDRNDQNSLLQNLIGQVTATKVGLLFGLGFMLVLAPLAWHLFRRLPGTQPSPAVQAYQRLCRRLARIGLARRRGESARQFSERIRQLRPDLAVSVQQATGLFERSAYQEDERALADLRELARHFRPASRPGKNG